MDEVRDYGAPGPLNFAVDDGEWLDETRGRRILWKRYRPLTEEPCPLIIYSHGLGGNRHSGAQWLSHWASWGIGALALQHPGTDDDAAGNSPLALRHLLRTAVDDSQLAIRQADLTFALDRIEAAIPDTTFGIAGHSYGAVSALRLIGEQRGCNDNPADPRVRAAVLFSPSARGGTQPLALRFSGISVPCLQLTGSRDDGIGPGDITAADRCLPHQHMTAADQHLLVLDGVNHVDLAGQGSGHELHIRLLKAATTSFWMAHLLGCDRAEHWLESRLPQHLATTDQLHRRRSQRRGAGAKKTG